MSRQIRKGYEPIPGYRLEKKLGEGQFGEVWRATSPGGTFVALKVLSLGRQQGWKEFRAIHPIKSIRHPHLAPILALWLLDDDGVLLSDDAVGRYGLSSLDNTMSPSDLPQNPQYLVFATTLCDESLNDRLKNCQQQGLQGIPVAELLNYMEEAAKGIDFLNSPQHDLGEGPVAVRHGDIKPDNIMLAGNCAVICDFGVARVLADAEAELIATTVEGSCAYMAPESLDSKLGVSSDQYSLAISYVQLRTGELPLETTFIHAVVAAIKAGKLDLSKLPEAERKVIKKATSVDAKRRYQSAGEMVKALRLAVAPPPKARRRAAPAVAIVAAAAVLIVAAIYLAVRPQPKPLAETLAIVVEVVPADASVMVDEQPVETVDGVTELERLGSHELTISVSHPPQYEDFSERRIVREIPSRWRIELTEVPKYRARRHRDEVTRLLAADFGQEQLQPAIEHYVEALKLDAGGHAAAPQVDRVFNHSDDDGAFAIRCMTASVDGGWIAARDRDNRVSLWKLDQLADEPTRIIEMPKTIINLSSLNQVLVVADIDDRTGIVYLSEAGDPLETVVPEQLPGVFFAIDPEGKSLVTGDQLGQIWLWDLAGRDGKAKATPLGKHTQQLTGLLMTPDGHAAISASADGSVKRWNLGNPGGGAENLGLYEGDVLELAVSPDGGFVASAVADRVTLTDLSTGAARSASMDGTDLVTILRFSPDSKSLVIGLGNGDLAVWRLDQEEAFSLPRGHDNSVDTISFGGLADFFASGGRDGRINIWSLSTPSKPPLTLAAGYPVKDVVLTDRWAVAACKNGTLLFWDLRLCCVVKSAADRTDIPIRVTPPPGSVREA